MLHFYALVNDIGDLYADFSEKRTILVFKGIVRQRLIENLTENLEKDLCIEDEVVRGKLVAIFIEIAQNVRLHSFEKEELEFERNGRGFLAVMEDDYAFCISSCNVVEEKSAMLLEARVNYINSLNHDDLREYFRRERRKPKRANSVGSNIGLIDMARRSENPLKISFKPIDETKRLFALRVFVNKSCSLIMNRRGEE
jgi:hypothetical protein